VDHEVKGVRPTVRLLGVRCRKRLS